MRFGATRSQIYDAQKTAPAREQELGAIDAAHAAAARDIAGRADVDQFAANRARDEKRTALTEKFRAAEQRGRGEYQDRRWTIDSTLEAGEKRAKEQLDSLKRKVVAGLERADALWDEAEPVLARGRVTRADVEHTGTPPAVGRGDPP